jgi:hypothetical protein
LLFTASVVPKALFLIVYRQNSLRFPIAFQEKQEPQGLQYQQNLKVGEYVSGDTRQHSW